MKIIDQNYNQKGISIYLALAIIAILLSSTLAVSVIFVSQVRILKEMGHSAIAFYAADAGIEKAMHGVYKTKSMIWGREDWSGDYGYEVTFGACEDNPDDTCVKSVGRYKNVRRAIEARIAGMSITFPEITDASVVPLSTTCVSPDSTSITIQANISDPDGIDPDSVKAFIQNPDETNIAEVSLSDIDGDGIYSGSWDCLGQATAAYYADIRACDLATPSYCSELENLETLVNL